MFLSSRSWQRIKITATQDSMIDIRFTMEIPIIFDEITISYQNDNNVSITVSDYDDDGRNYLNITPNHRRTGSLRIENSAIFTPMRFRQNGLNAERLEHVDEIALCNQFQVNGFCDDKLERICQFIHGEFCCFCEQWSLHPFDSKQFDNHLLLCRNHFYIDDDDDNNGEVLSDSNRNDDNNRSIDIGQDFSQNGEEFCTICWEELSEQNRSISIRPQDLNNYGMLANCDHYFHFDCIIQWARNHSSERSFPCPNCRIPSMDILQHSKLIKNRLVKQQMINRFEIEDNCRTKCIDYFVHRFYLR